MYGTFTYMSHRNQRVNIPVPWILWVIAFNWEISWNPRWRYGQRLFHCFVTWCFLKLRLKRERKGNGSMVGGLKYTHPFWWFDVAKIGKFVIPKVVQSYPMRFGVLFYIFHPFNPPPKTTTAEGSSEHMGSRMIFMTPSPPYYAPFFLFVLSGWTWFSWITNVCLVYIS